MSIFAAQSKFNGSAAASIGW